MLSLTSSNVTSVVESLCGCLLYDHIARDEVSNYPLALFSRDADSTETQVK